MTTYTTPHFANGLPQRSNVRTEPDLNRARPASAATYRPAGVSNEAAVLADGPTPDWQPGAAQGGVPKAAIGALGAAMVGGVALAIVLLAPSNKATRPVVPEPIAQAAAQTGDGQKSVVTPPADVQTPAMRETPQASTVTPSSPAPVTDQPTPDTPATAPAH